MDKGVNAEIWVWIDLRNERLFGFSLNVLAKARELAKEMGGRTAAVLADAKNYVAGQDAAVSQPCMDAEVAAGQCVCHGADVAYVMENPELICQRADIMASALAKVVNRRRPALVLMALTDFGRELASMAARIDNAGLIADCADLRIEKGEVIATCPSWGGDIMAEITFTDKRSTGFATVQCHVRQPTQTRGEPGTVEKIAVDGLKRPKGITLVASFPELGEHQKLEEADIVVVGGAGMGNAEGFGMVSELAAALGGEVGATRPPVLQHWVDDSRLIGQTGKSVKPRLLFSIGTSGAVQYTAGIMEAGTIVAINRDHNAPIFQIADLGLVADWKRIVPLLSQKANQFVMRRLADALSAETGRKESLSFGSKVRGLRKARQWTPDVLAQKTEQSLDFIAQVENDEIAPPVSFLLALARALDVDPSTFLRAEEKAAIHDRRAQAFIKRTANYSYEVLTPDAEKEHLRAFMITIEPRQVHKVVEYKHEGEEFIFVLEGDLEVTLGSKVHHLKLHESIRFNSNIAHKLKSRCDEVTRCLVVLYTP